MVYIHYDNEECGRGTPVFISSFNIYCTIAPPLNYPTTPLTFRFFTMTTIVLSYFHSICFGPVFMDVSSVVFGKYSLSVACTLVVV